MYRKNDNEPSVEQTDSEAGSPPRYPGGGPRSAKPLPSRKILEDSVSVGECRVNVDENGEERGVNDKIRMNDTSDKIGINDNIDKIRVNDNIVNDKISSDKNNGKSASAHVNGNVHNTSRGDNNCTNNRNSSQVNQNGQATPSNNDTKNNSKIYSNGIESSSLDKISNSTEVQSSGENVEEKRNDNSVTLAEGVVRCNGSKATAAAEPAEAAAAAAAAAAVAAAEVTTVYDVKNYVVKSELSCHSVASRSKQSGCGKGLFDLVKKRKRNPSSTSSVSASPSSSSVSSSSSGSSSSSSSESEDELIPNSPDGGWGWMVVLASFIAHLIADGCAFSFGILFADLLNSFNESKFKTAWVGSLFVSMPAICGPIASIMTNLLGCRMTTAIGGVIAAVGCFISAFATSVDMLCVTYGIIAGFGLALVYVPAVIIVAFYFEKKRSFATGLAVSGSGIGTFLFAPLTEQLISVYTWRGAMFVMSGLMLNIVVCATLFRPLVAHKLQVKRRRYLRSLERFSRVSSRIQSHDALDRRSVVCDHEPEDALNCVFCRADADIEPLSHSLIELPTYLTKMGSIDGRDLCINDSSLLKVRRQSSLSLNIATCGVSQPPAGTITVVSEGREQSVMVGVGNLVDGRRQRDHGLETDVACLGFIDPLRGNFISEEKTVRVLSTDATGPEQKAEVADVPTDQVLVPMNVTTDVVPAKPSTKKKDAPRKARHHGSLETVRVKKSPGQFPLRFVPQCRTDIFYRGSLLKAGFLLSRGQSASCPDVYVHSPRRRHSRRASLCQRLRAMGLRSLWDAVKEACDFRIFGSVIFLSFCLHSLLLYLSYDIPYVYVPDMATQAGIHEEFASLLISIVGISSTLGQVVMGYFGDRPYINCFYFYIAMIMLAGAPIFFIPLLGTFPALATFCALFGFFISANYALTTIIVVDLLGMDQLTNAYGFVSLAEGLANLFGPPLAGFIADLHGYSVTFYLAGAGVMLSALILLVVPLIRKCEGKGKGGRRRRSVEGGEEEEDLSEGGSKRSKDRHSSKSDSSSENHVRFSVDY